MAEGILPGPLSGRCSVECLHTGGFMASDKRKGQSAGMNLSVELPERDGEKWRPAPLFFPG